MTHADKTSATVNTSNERSHMTIAEYCEGREPTAEEVRSAEAFNRVEPKRATAAGATAVLPSTSPLLGVAKRLAQGAESARTAAAVVLRHAEQNDLFAQNGYGDIDDFVARELPELASTSAIKKYRQAAGALEKYFPDLHGTILARVTGPQGHTCVPADLPALPSPSILVALDRALRRVGADGREGLLEKVANRTITVRALEEFGREPDETDEPSRENSDREASKDPQTEAQPSAVDDVDAEEDGGDYVHRVVGPLELEDPLVQLYLRVVNELDDTWDAFYGECGQGIDERLFCEMFRKLWLVLSDRLDSLCPATGDLVR